MFWFSCFFVGEKNQLPKDEDIEEFAPTGFLRLPENQLSAAKKLLEGDYNPESFNIDFDFKPIQGPARFYRQPYQTLTIRSQDYAIGP